MLRSQPHESDADRLTEAALRLKPKQRVRLVERLLASVEPDPDLLASNEAEAARRLKEADEGKVKLLPWSEARKLAFPKKRRK